MVLKAKSSRSMAIPSVPGFFDSERAKLPSDKIGISDVFKADGDDAVALVQIAAAADDRVVGDVASYLLPDVSGEYAEFCV